MTIAHEIECVLADEGSLSRDELASITGEDRYDVGEVLCDMLDQGKVTVVDQRGRIVYTLSR